MVSELVKFCNPKSAQKALWTRLPYAGFTIIDILWKSLKNLKLAQSPMEWHFYDPNKAWILYWAWKSLKIHTSDLDIIAQNEERSRTEPVFQPPQTKVHENFSIQLKTDRQKTHFRSEKTWESIESNFFTGCVFWKIVHTGKSLAIRFTSL